METLSTKEGREAVRQSQFSNLTEKGWNRETYKGLDIFTIDEPTILLKVFRDNKSEAMFFYKYRSQEQRTKRIEEAKLSYDSHLEYKQKNPPRKTGAAECAEAIREELKKVFPGVKFSVRSKNFSMGDSVDIDWTDGPTTKMVDEITGKYSQGHFDGMTDMYNYYENRGNLPGAKYVMTSRHMSKETGAILLPDAEKIYNECSNPDSHNAQNLLYRIFSKCSIPLNAKITGIVRTDQNCGVWEDLYTIGYESCEPVKLEKVEVEPGKVNIIQYSEKAIAVIGDTKPIKDTLKSLGGSFNFRLSCGAGWIFPAAKLETIKNALTIRG